MKLFGIVVLLSFGVVSCAGAPIDIKRFGADFDDLCIAGKLTEESAELLNRHLGIWKQHGDYTDSRGETPLKDGDRLFNGDCSLVTKLLIKGDYEGSLGALDRVKSRGNINNN